MVIKESFRPLTGISHSKLEYSKSWNAIEAEEKFPSPYGDKSFKTNIENNTEKANILGFRPLTGISHSKPDNSANL